jgi:hypothetical protein
MQEDLTSKKNPDGNFTFLTISFTLHNVDWMLKDIPERKIARRLLKNVLANINE